MMPVLGEPDTSFPEPDELPLNVFEEQDRDDHAELGEFPRFQGPHAEDVDPWSIQDEQDIFEAAVALAASAELLMDADDSDAPMVQADFTRHYLEEIHVQALNLISDQAIRIYKRQRGLKL